MADLIEYFPVLGLLGSGWRGDYLVVLKAHFDASGGLDDQPVCVVAGYVASLESWTNSFEGPWARALKENDLTFFHMTDYAACKGAFEGWEYSPRRREERFLGFVDIILSTVRFGMASGITMQTFDKYKDRLKDSMGIEYAWQLCALRCVLQLFNWRNVGKHAERIALAFENGDLGYENMEFAVKQFAREFTGDFEPSAPIVVGSKTDLPPLQSADILAWEYANLMKQQMGISQWAYPTPGFERLVLGKEHIEEQIAPWTKGCRLRATCSLAESQRTACSHPTRRREDRGWSCSRRQPWECRIHLR